MPKSCDAPDESAAIAPRSESRTVDPAMPGSGLPSSGAALRSIPIRLVMESVKKKTRLAAAVWNRRAPSPLLW